MSDRPASQLTLRDLFTAAERQSRELVTHLDLNFTSKLKGVERLVRPARSAEERSKIADITVRNHTAQLLDSDAYSAKLFAKLDEYATAIDEQVERIVDANQIG